MRSFTGFDPDRTKRRAVGIPPEFFSELLPQIGNINELKVTLHLFYLAAAKQSDPKWVGYWEMAESEELLRGLRRGGDPRQPVEHLREGLELALSRGSILRIVAERDVQGEEAVILNRAVGDTGVLTSSTPEYVEWFLVNTPANRTFAAALERGDVGLAQTSLLSEDAGWRYIQRSALGKPDSSNKIIDLAVRTQRPDIFTLYEQNIGPLTPLMAERLREAAQTYSAAWIEDAFGEALTHNKRNWAYINRVLENWQMRGRVAESNRDNGYESQNPSFRRPNTAVPPSKSARSSAPDRRSARPARAATERPRTGVPDFGAGDERSNTPAASDGDRAGTLWPDDAAAVGTVRPIPAGEPIWPEGDDPDADKYINGKYSQFFNRKRPAPPRRG